MRRSIATAFLLAFCLIDNSYSNDQNAEADAKANNKLYHQWHNICLNGDTDQIDAQIIRFEARLKTTPDDQLARVYLGSACALRAKASFWVLTKLRYLKRGQKLMDEAVHNAPEQPRVRLIRAIGSYKVPEKFGRRKIAIADFEKLMPVAADGPSNLADNERQVILYYAWLTFKDDKHPQADKAKALCHAIAPNSKYGKLTTP
jgi:hypothetical protein